MEDPLLAIHLVGNASCYEHYLNTIDLLYLQWRLFGITKVKDKLKSRSMTISHSRTIISKLLLPTSCWSQVDLHTPDLWLTTYPPYAYSTWKYIKISYLRKIELRCIRTTLTTAAYIDGFTQETGDQSEISNLRRLFNI